VEPLKDHTECPKTKKSRNGKASNEETWTRTKTNAKTCANVWAGGKELMKLDLGIVD